MKSQRLTDYLEHGIVESVNNRSTAMERQAYLQLERAAEAAPRSVVEAAAEAIAAGQEQARAPFVARAFHALAQLASRLEADVLSDAAGAPSDLHALVRVLEHPDVSALLAAR